MDLKVLLFLLVEVAAAAVESFQDTYTDVSTVVDVETISAEPDITITIDWLFSTQHETYYPTEAAVSTSVIVTTVCPSKCSVVTLTTLYKPAVTESVPQLSTPSSVATAKAPCTTVYETDTVSTVYETATVSTVYESTDVSLESSKLASVTIIVSPVGTSVSAAVTTVRATTTLSTTKTAGASLSVETTSPSLEAPTLPIETTVPSSETTSHSIETVSLSKQTITLSSHHVTSPSSEATTSEALITVSIISPVPWTTTSSSLSSSSSTPCTTDFTVTRTTTKYESWASTSPITTTLVRTRTTTIESQIVEAYSTWTGEETLQGVRTTIETLESVSTNSACTEEKGCVTAIAESQVTVTRAQVTVPHDPVTETRPTVLVTEESSEPVSSGLLRTATSTHTYLDSTATPTSSVHDAPEGTLKNEGTLTPSTAAASRPVGFGVGALVGLMVALA